MIETINGVTAERRYFTNWTYNAARVLDELEKIVLNNGGQLASTWRNLMNRKTYWITNRALSEAVRKQRERVAILAERNRPALAEQRAELERLEAINNEPVLSYYGDYLYINFVLNGTYYYYQMDRNPFFDFLYSKHAVVDGAINPDVYSTTDEKEWLYDCFFRFDCPDEYRKQAAGAIFEMLISAEPCRPYRGGRRPQKLYFEV